MYRRDPQLRDLRLHAYSFYRLRLPGLSVDVDDDRIEMRRPLGDLEPVRRLIEEPPDGLLFLDADDRVGGPRHARVRYESGARREDALVSRLDVGMGPHDGACLSVDVPCQGGFLRRGLRVEIDDYHACFLLELFNLADCGAEGVFQVRHEDPAFEI